MGAIISYRVSHQNKKSCKYSTKFHFSVDMNALFSFVFSNLYINKSLVCFARVI
jgi:hypothetical protein